MRAHDQRVPCPHCDYFGRPLKALAFPRIKNKGSVKICRACKGVLDVA